ncbi:hypothetical protein ABZW03_14015 [Kitasatospora sp. NPDC004799]|uniref:hypothetical protein n=1 Tax=Kitasatospora sp. NPDC004799 TaxID=3154460 RepID=UPI0033AA9FD6
MIPLPTGTAAGPHDAAFLPRRQLSPRPAEQPITAPGRAADHRARPQARRRALPAGRAHLAALPHHR